MGDIKGKKLHSEEDPLSFQEMIFSLSRFWADQGCVVALPYDVEVGAGTMCPETFFRVLGPRPWRVAYVQPSRRPADGRYGENPNRLLKHTQMQVILKPPPSNIQEIYLESLGALGIDIRHHDVRFEEDNWEAPTLGAWGIGWQVMLDGLEITQFTYFQQSGGVDLEPISVELTYGLERIAAFLENVHSVYEVKWNKSLNYGDLRRDEELEMSLYDFEMADPETCRKILDLYEGEVMRLLAMYPDQKAETAKRKLENGEASTGGEKDAGDASFQFPVSNFQSPVSSFQNAAGAGQADAGATSSCTLSKARFPLRKLYDLTLKCSHLFNILDARGAISVTERVALIARVRRMACRIAAIYLDRLPAAEVGR